MNKQIALKRLNEVLNVDSIDSSKADFLSTHVPFRRIMVTKDLAETPVSVHMPEDEVFSKYFNNSEKYNEHQLLVVDGSSGSGKSHFIRWIEAKLSAVESQNDVVLMIRRSDNTLKGTIKQFLNIEEVKNIKNKDIYERLVQANQNISEQKFKYKIYHEFLVEISDDKETILSDSDQKNFRELLSSSEFEERMLRVGGPIERIYSKIVDNNTKNDEDVLALFALEDFILDYDFNMKLKSNASRRAVKMANKLLPENDGSFTEDDCNPKILMEYMNSKVDTVIKTCVGLKPGDFQQIFKEIRQELYLQGKNLILLIEDITACTGINRDLLDALIVKHTGENEQDKMCRLLSVIGTTTEYFGEFRSNYLDRITALVTIEDGSIGNNQDDLIQFVAKYLNVMSVGADTINKWHEDGALETEYPIHMETEVDSWEYYTYHGKKISLYPFTKRAIINLYHGMDEHKTPRYIIRKIIEPAVDGIIQEKSMFPKFLLSKKPKLSHEVADRVKSTVTNLPVSEEEKAIITERLLAILSYWGDNTLDTSKRGYLGAINVNVFKEFGLTMFAENILGYKIDDSSLIIESEDIPSGDINDQNEKSFDGLEIIPEQKEILKPVVNKAFEDFAKILMEWHYDKKSFTKVYQVRDALNKFIFTNLPWQQEGVPLVAVQMVEMSIYDLVEIERQDKKVGKGLFLLEDSDETYQLLLAIGKSVYLGKKREGNTEYTSWDFEGAASSIRVATSWLEKYKKTFVDIVKAFDDKEKAPDYLKCAMIAEIYRGLLNGDQKVSKVSDIKIDFFTKDNNLRKKGDLVGHSKEWAELVNNIVYANNDAELNIELTQRYFNLIQGNQKNAKRKIFNYTLLEVIFKELRSDSFEIDIESIENDKIKGRNEPKDYLKKILSRTDIVVAAEFKEAQMLYEEAISFFGFPDDSEIETEDIKELLNEIIEFYKDTEINGINIALKTNEALALKDRGADISKAFSLISMDMSILSTIDKVAIYSKNPMRIIKQFMGFLKRVDEDRINVHSEMIAAKEMLTRSGNWSDDVDPRFDDNKSAFEDLMNLLED